MNSDWKVRVTLLCVAILFALAGMAKWRGERKAYQASIAFHRYEIEAWKSVANMRAKQLETKIRVIANGEDIIYEAAFFAAAQQARGRDGRARFTFEGAERVTLDIIEWPPREIPAEIGQNPPEAPDPTPDTPPAPAVDQG